MHVVCLIAYHLSVFTTRVWEQGRECSCVVKPMPGRCKAPGSILIMKNEAGSKDCPLCCSFLYPQAENSVCNRLLPPNYSLIE
jgi:hypothetical protein